MAVYDVVVVGGGPAGSASAALFADQGRKVLVLDAARFPRPKPCAEYISPGGVAILNRLGVLERIASERTGRWLRGMEIHAPNGGRHVVDYCDEDGRRQYGLSVPRLVLDAALLESARARGAEVREGFRVRDVWTEDQHMRGIVGASGERVKGDLVVGADGLHSVVARAVGARRPTLWPRRLGLIAHYAAVDWPEDYGKMLIGRQGYVGIGPLDSDGMVTVGFVRPMASGRLGSPEAALQAGLDEYPLLRERLSHGRRVGGVTGIGPLATSVRTVAEPGYALVGDAAGFFDPVTGEGIFRALRGAELLADGPPVYARQRRIAFRPKERFVTLIQIIVQTPRLMDLAVNRLQTRKAVARELGMVLGDLRPARLDLIWRLLGP